VAGRPDRRQRCFLERGEESERMREKEERACNRTSIRGRASARVTPFKSYVAPPPTEHAMAPLLLTLYYTLGALRWMSIDEKQGPFIKKKNP
jgi:hypothetical protein